MFKKFILNRDVTVKECHWLPRDFKKGEVLYEYPGYTYGVIGPSGIACTENAKGDYPFFEIPSSAISKEIF